LLKKSSTTLAVASQSDMSDMDSLLVCGVLSPCNIADTAPLGVRDSVLGFFFAFFGGVRAFYYKKPTKQFPHTQ